MKLPPKLIVLLIAAVSALVITPLSAIKIVVPDQYKDQIEAIKEAERSERKQELQGANESTDSGLTVDLPEDKAEDNQSPEVDADEFIVMPVVEPKIDAQETLGEGEGRIAGQVFDKESGQPLRGVAILVEGTDFGTVTDSKGRYRISNVPSATHTLSFIKPGYIEATVTDTRVMEGELMKLDFALLPRPSDMSDEVYVLQDFTVTAEEAASQNVALLALRQTSVSSLEALSSEDFAKFAAGDAADAISKMSGASLSDGKYVVFRGLNDRYNTTLINGVRLPSPDPDRKAVALDIFPTSLFDSIVARKTYTTDLPGESSGGSVELRTQSVPDEPFVKFSFGGGGQLNSSQTEDFLADPEQVSLADWIRGKDVRGFDVDPVTGGLTDNYPNNAGGVSFPLMAPNEKKLSGFGDRSYSFSAGGSKQFADWLTLGTVVGIKVSEKQRTSFKEKFEIDIETLGSIGLDQAPRAVLNKVAGSGLVDLGLITPTEATLNGQPFGGALKSEEEYSSSVLLGLGAQILDHSSLNYSFLRSENLTSTVEQTLYYKFVQDVPGIAGGLPNNEYYKFLDIEITTQDRLLQAHQFSGEHIFELGNTGEWTTSWYYTAAEMEQNEPDQRFVSEFALDWNGYDTISPPNVLPMRFQRETQQDSSMRGFNLEKEVEIVEDALTIGLDLGYGLESSEREFRQLESEVEFTGSKVDTPRYAAMPFPDPSGAALDQLVEELGMETFYDAFVDETLTGGVNELVEELYERAVETQQSQFDAEQITLNTSQNAFNGAQNDFNNAQTSLNNQIASWEGFTGVDYETEFDPGNSFHTSAETFLGIPTAQVTLADSQTALDTTQDRLDEAQADFDAESARNTLIQDEQANYQAAAAALIAQIASTPALATDPTAFPDFSFFGDQEYILNTPRGFSVYGDSMPTNSNIQFSSVDSEIEARGESNTESFYFSGNLNFTKVPIFESIRLAGGYRRESTELSYERVTGAGPNEGILSATVGESAPIDQSNNLAYMAVIFEITENLKLHISHSNTVAKPTFREIAPFPIYNLSDESLEFGNPGFVFRSDGKFRMWQGGVDDYGEYAPADPAALRDPGLGKNLIVGPDFAGLEIAEVESRDIRLEYFTPLDGLLAVGYFEKDVGAPIERVFAYQPNGIDLNTFINNNNDAELSGFEVELQQNLGIINDWVSQDILPFDWLTIGGNYTKIDAEVERSSFEIRNLATLQGISSSRPLYDQPSFVANAFVSLDIEKTGTLITLSQNWLGEQLERVGGLDDSLSGSADIYWDEFTSINLVIEQALTDHIKLKFSVKNLDSPVRSTFEDAAFYNNMVASDLLTKDGEQISTSAVGYKRTSQTVEPSYSISISGSF